jgi:hypothetical protein
MEMTTKPSENPSVYAGCDRLREFESTLLRKIFRNMSEEVRSR